MFAFGFTVCHEKIDFHFIFFVSTLIKTLFVLFVSDTLLLSKKTEQCREKHFKTES